MYVVRSVDYLWLLRVKIGVRVTFARTLDRHTMKCSALAAKLLVSVVVVHSDSRV